MAPALILATLGWADDAWCAGHWMFLFAHRILSPTWIHPLLLKGIQRVPKPWESKGKSQKATQEGERLEGQEENGEARTAWFLIGCGMAGLRGCGGLQPFVLPHHAAMYQVHLVFTGTMLGGFSNICALIILFLISDQWSPVSPECPRFLFPSSSVTLHSDSWSTQKIWKE